MKARKPDWLDEVVDVLLESTDAELEALEREPRRPVKKKAKRAAKDAKPRDELGRFAPKAKQ